MKQTITDITVLSSKGQIVLPKKIRDTLLLNTGSKLMALTDGETIILKPIKELSNQEVSSLINKANKLTKDVNSK